MAKKPSRSSLTGRTQRAVGEKLAGIANALKIAAANLARARNALEELRGLQLPVKTRGARPPVFRELTAWKTWIDEGKGTAVQHSAIISRSVHTIHSAIRAAAERDAPKHIGPTDMAMLVTMKRLQARAGEKPLWHTAEDLRKCQGEGIPDDENAMHKALRQLTVEGLAQRRNKGPAQWTLTPAAHELVAQADRRYFEPLASTFERLPQDEQKLLAGLVQEVVRPAHSGGLSEPTADIPAVVDFCADLGRLHWMLYDEKGSSTMGPTEAAALIHVSSFGAHGLPRTQLLTSTGLWSHHFEHLEEERLLTRTQTLTPDRRRQSIVTITPEGQALVDKLVQHPDQCRIVPFVPAVAHLGPEKSAQLARLMQKLAEGCVSTTPPM